MKRQFLSPQIPVSTDLFGLSDFLKKLFRRQWRLQTIRYFQGDCAHISVYVQPMNSCQHSGMDPFEQYHVCTVCSSKMLEVT